MADLNKESMAIWKSIKPMIDEEIKAQTRGSVQRRKMKVTTAPSLVTNVIGVTEPYGTEMLIPFNTNLSTANVGDVVWVEFMYGATNAFASMYASADTKDFTVGGVLDVIQRRCSATLSSAGWYRAVIYNAYDSYSAQGTSGEIVDINIVWTATNNCGHHIKLFLDYGKVAFLGEESNGTYNIVDKIRYTYSGSIGYIDIHFVGLSSGSVPVHFAFDVTTRTYANSYWVAGTLASVAAAPSGETVLTEYSFGANGVYTNADLTVNGTFDVVPRRCSATLSSAGWYRVLDVSPLTSAMAQGALGESIRFDISRRGSSNDAETHTIVYRAVNGGKGRFTDESSKSGSLLIDKIRYTYTSNSAHIDIHYDTSNSNAVTVYFDVNVVPDVQFRFTANNLTSVADAPSGETVRATYEFASNTRNGALLREDITVGSTTLAAGSATSISKTLSKTGYTPIGVIGFYGTSNGNVAVGDCFINSSNVLSMYLINTGTSSKTPTMYAKVLWQKD